MPCPTNPGSVRIRLTDTGRVGQLRHVQYPSPVPAAEPSRSLPGVCPNGAQAGTPCVGHHGSSWFSPDIPPLYGVGLHSKHITKSKIGGGLDNHRKHMSTLRQRRARHMGDATQQRSRRDELLEVSGCVFNLPHGMPPLRSRTNVLVASHAFSRGLAASGLRSVRQSRRKAR